MKISPPWPFDWHCPVRFLATGFRTCKEGFCDNSDPFVRRQHLVTVLWMRAFALVAQLLLLFAVVVFLKISLPWVILLFILAMLGVLNGIAFFRLKKGFALGGFEVLAQLFADLLGFSFVLYFTGGVTNPFVSFYLPLLGLAAALLPWVQVAFLALVSVIAYTVLMSNYVVLILPNPEDGVHFHLLGMWLNFLISVLILVGFVARLSSSIRNRDRALSQAQQRLVTDSRLAALGTQAASIAHQLGTPVSTIATVIADWQHEACFKNHAAEMNMLRAQVQSVTDTLSQLRAQIGADPRQAEHMQWLNPVEWLNSTLNVWRTCNPQCEVCVKPSVSATRCEFKVKKEILELGLITLLDNAGQSQQRCGIQSPLEVDMQWNASGVTLRVSDAGGGIEPALLPGIGKQLLKAHGQGMGLFLLTSLLEREGGHLSLKNLQMGVCASLSLPVCLA